MRRSRNALCLLAAGALALATSSSARAQESAHDRADALFREGRAATQSGDYATACTKFTESQRLDPSTGTLVNLGNCAEHLGRLLAARNYFQDAISQLGEGDPRLKPAKERLASLEKRLPHLTIALAPGAPSGSSIQRDGRPMPDPEFGAAIPLDPGEHTITAAAPGWRETRTVVTLREGESQQVAIKPAEASALSKDVAPAAQPHASPLYVGGWVIGGIGVAGLALAGVSGMVLINEKSTADSGCTNKMDCNPAAQSAISASKTWLVVNTVSWIVGAVGVAAGGYLVLSQRDARPVASVVVGLLPGGAGVSGLIALE